MFLYNDPSLVRVNTTLKTYVTARETSYSIVYTSGVTEYINRYSVNYTSQYPVPNIQRYTISYTTTMGDAVQTYYIRYTSGVELQETTVRYVVKYTTEQMIGIVVPYSIKYTSISPAESVVRKIYRIRYSTESYQDRIENYTIKYSTATYNPITTTYTIKYTSLTPYRNYVKSTLLRRSSGTLDAILQIEGSIEDSKLVLNQMPRIDSFLIGEGNSVFIREIEGVYVGLFSEIPGRKYKYYLIEDVSSQGLSLDIYDRKTSKRTNKSKTFFFNLESFVNQTIFLNGVVYEAYNDSYNNYNKDLFHYMEEEITPTFKATSSCCFNTKISDKGVGGACSPF